MIRFARATMLVTLAVLSAAMLSGPAHAGGSFVPPGNPPIPDIAPLPPTCDSSLFNDTPIAAYFTIKVCRQHYVDHGNKIISWAWLEYTNITSTDQHIRDIRFHRFRGQGITPTLLHRCMVGWVPPQQSYGCKLPKVVPVAWQVVVDGEALRTTPLPIGTPPFNWFRFEGKPL